MDGTVRDACTGGEVGIDLEEGTPPGEMLAPLLLEGTLAEVLALQQAMNLGVLVPNQWIKGQPAQDP